MRDGGTFLRLLRYAYLIAITVLLFRSQLGISETTTICVALTFAVLMAAICLYWIKQNAKSSYGLGETCAGIVVTWSALDRSAGHLAADPAPYVPHIELAFFGGGLYLMIRGIQNFVDGLRQETKQTSSADTKEGADRIAQQLHISLLKTVFMVLIALLPAIAGLFNVIRGHVGSGSLSDFWTKVLIRTAMSTAGCVLMPFSIRLLKRGVQDLFGASSGAKREKNRVTTRIFSIAKQNLSTISTILITLVAIAEVVPYVFPLKQYADALTLKLSVSLTKSLIAGILLLVAIALYWVKRSTQQIYGVGEMTIGMASNWKAVSALVTEIASKAQPQIVYPKVVLLAGGAYLLGRGIQNFNEGQSQSPNQKWRQKLETAIRAVVAAGRRQLPNSDLVILVLVISVALAAVLGVATFFDDRTDEDSLTSDWTKTMVLLVVFALALVLHWLKTNARRFYGTVEIIAGLASNWTTLNGLVSAPPDRGYGYGPLLLLAGAYLLGRGIQNYSEGDPLNLAARVSTFAHTHTGGPPNIL